MNLYDKYEQKANRASFLITILVLIVLLSFFEFNTLMEVQAEVEAPASYEVTVLDSSAILEEPKTVEEVKTAQSINPVKDKFQSEEKIDTKVKDKTKIEKKNKPKKERKILKNKEKPMKNEKNYVNDAKNPAKDSNSKKVASDSENTKIAKEVVESAQKKQSYNLAFNSLLAFLSSKKQYPLKAKRLNHEGECVIGFKVDKTGKVVSASLKKSSDYPLLDRECNNLASKAVGFDSKIVDRELNVYVPVSFKLTSL